MRTERYNREHSTSVFRGRRAVLFEGVDGYKPPPLSFCRGDGVAIVRVGAIRTAHDGNVPVGHDHNHDEINRKAYPDIDLGAMKQLLADLPDDWRMIADGGKTILLFDAEMNGQGCIDLDTKQIVTLQD